MVDYHTNALNESLRLLLGSPYLAAAVTHLTANSEAVNSELGNTVLEEIPAFTDSANPDILPDLARHGPQHTVEIIRLLKGEAVGNLGFVREHAHLRAEQHFPLEATLHAYRCGHKVFSRWLRESILTGVASPQDAQQAIAAVADFAIEYTDAISTVFASEYLSQTRLLTQVAGDRRAQLLSILLDGYDESDGRVANILRSAGYLDRRQSFCVVLGQPVDPAEMLNPSRARRLADSMDKALKHPTIRRLIDVRNNNVTMVLSDVRRTSGWTAPGTALARRITSDLTTLGNSVLVGISNDVPSTSQIPFAHREAILALELADVSRRVVQISDVSMNRLMLHLVGEDMQRVLPSWTESLYRADSKHHGALTATIRAYADSNMNVLKAAERLSLHPNTIYARLAKIAELTGLNAKNYHDLNELHLVVDSRAH